MKNNQWNLHIIQLYINYSCTFLILLVFFTSYSCIFVSFLIFAFHFHASIAFSNFWFQAIWISHNWVYVLLQAKILGIRGKVTCHLNFIAISALQSQYHKCKIPLINIYANKVLFKLNTVIFRLNSNLLILRLFISFTTVHLKKKKFKIVLLF